MLKCNRTSGRLAWNPENTPPEIATALRALALEYAQLQESGTLGRTMVFERLPPGGGDGESRCEVLRGGERVVIRYGTLSSALRGVGFAMGMYPGKCSMPFRRLGIMLDLSRNRVFTVANLKTYMTRLALMGYNTIYLYCEDTFEMEGEPYFGYMRGAYTMDELRQIDDWGAQLGIEVVGCIELLGHFSQILRWQAYEDIRDTGWTMLADCEKTYELTAKILDFWSRALRSRRIHIGMDEVHDLGRGRYYDIHGDVPHFEIFNRHLGRIKQQCDQLGLSPMIWSDMYFRIADREKHDYYSGSHIPEEVARQIPENVGMVYWDYYHRDRETYRKMFDAHFALNRPVVFAGGVWTWGRLWYDHVQTMETTKPALAEAKAAKVDEVMFTMWGDDGGYCDFESALAGLQCVADLAYGMDVERCAESQSANRRFAALCGGNLAGTLLAGSIETAVLLSKEEYKLMPYPLPLLLFDDPLLGVGDRICVSKSVAPMNHLIEGLVKAQKMLRHYRCTGGGDFVNLNNALRLLVLKLKLRRRLVDAYEKDDRAELMDIADVGAREALKACIAYRRSFSKQWCATSKPFGVELIEGRIGALTARIEVMAERIAAYLDGEADTIPELEYRPKLTGDAPCVFQIERFRLGCNPTSTF